MGQSFSAALYLAANRDVAASGINPLLHYLLDGWAQGRPLRPGPHAPPPLPASAVLGWRERLQAWLRHIRPRRRALHPEPGPDPAGTIRIRPARGAMPSGWCLISALGQPADLLVVTGGITLHVEVPAAPATALVQLPDIPAQLSLRRRDRPGPGAAPRPVIVARELGGPWAWAIRRRRDGVALTDATSYDSWARLFDSPTEAQTAAMAERAARLAGPRFAIEGEALAGQLYRNWHVGAPMPGDFVVFVAAGAVLAPWALLLAAEAIVADPTIDVLYADEDWIVDGVRRDPWFKPDFSAERQAGGDLVGAFWVARATQGKNIRHLPHILAHRTLTPALVSSGAQARESGRGGVAAPAVAISPPLPLAGEGRGEGLSWPRVTAIIPTRDHADILRACLDGLFHHTDYPALDIIVADNGSSDPEALAVLESAARRGVTVLPCPGPFNYSAINNRATAMATGEMLLFLNNDISMPREDWLKRLVALARRPGIGAVGAKLLYPDGTLQHGGVVLGMGGVAGHVQQGAAGDDPGYFGQLGMTREVSAVTAACMLVPSAALAAVGGFDETHLAVAFNDIDLCSRLRRAGWRVLWTPDAVLTHWESKSRGSDFSPDRIRVFSAEIATMQERWATELASDPFFSPNLSLETTDVAWAFPPRAPRPWD